MANIHPSAVVDSAAQLGEKVTIGPGCVIDRDVQLGAGTVLGPHVVLYAGVRCGQRCRFHAGVVVGDEPQDLAFAGGPSQVIIGDDVNIRETVTIHRGTEEGTATRIGDECMIMAGAHIAHNACLGRKVLVVSGALVAGYVQIDDGAFLSGNVQIHQFCHIGRLSITGGGASITKDLPPFCMAHSGAYNRLCGLNTIGLRRAGVTGAARMALKSAYKKIFTEGVLHREAIAEIKEAPMCPEVTELISFIESSKRGVLVPTPGSASHS